MWLKLFNRPKKPQKADLETSWIFYVQLWNISPIKWIGIWSKWHIVVHY